MALGTISNLIKKYKRFGYVKNHPRSRVLRQKPFFSKTHQERRLAFAKKYANMPLSFWKKVLWTNKSKFNLVKLDRAQKVWRKKGQSFKLSYIRGTVKFGSGKVMVW